MMKDINKKPTTFRIVQDSSYLEEQISRYVKGAVVKTKDLPQAPIGSAQNLVNYVLFRTITSWSKGKRRVFSVA